MKAAAGDDALLQALIAAGNSGQQPDSATLTKMLPLMSKCGMTATMAVDFAKAHPGLTQTQAKCFIDGIFALSAADWAILTGEGQMTTELQGRLTKMVLACNIDPTKL
jgi:hypothetical protein